MKSRNIVELLGNVGAAPEIRQTTGGKTVANFQLATNFSFRDRSSGERTEKTEWHRIVAFGPLAELVEKYISSGSPLLAIGRLQTRKWQSQDGQDRWTTEVILEDMHFLPGAPGRPVNEVTLLGNVGEAPEVRFTAAGNAVANFQMATNHRYTNRSTGEKVENTDWHRLVAFGKVAELVQTYVSSGTPLYVKGRIQTRKWQGQDGQDRYTTEVVINDMSRFAKKNGNGKANGNGASTPAPTSSAPPVEPTAPVDDFDDDIPVLDCPTHRGSASRRPPLSLPADSTSRPYPQAQGRQAGPLRTHQEDMP